VCPSIFPYLWYPFEKRVVSWGPVQPRKHGGVKLNTPRGGERARGHLWGRGGVVNQKNNQGFFWGGGGQIQQTQLIEYRRGEQKKKGWGGRG